MAGDDGQAAEAPDRQLSRASLERAIRSGDGVLLDSSVLIAYLGPPSPTTPVAKHVIDGFVRSGRNPATLSAVSVTEVLVDPIRSGAAAMIAGVVEFLLRFPNVSLREIDFAVAREAAALRARYRLRTPDALVIASGLRAGIEHLISDDAEWTKLRDLSPEIRVHQLTDHLPFP